MQVTRLPATKRATFGERKQACQVSQVETDWLVWLPRMESNASRQKINFLGVPNSVVEPGATRPQALGPRRHPAKHKTILRILIQTLTGGTPPAGVAQPGIGVDMDTNTNDVVAAKVAFRKSRSEMTPEELHTRRAYDAQKARESRAHRRAEKDAQQARTQPESAGELPAALGMLWGVGAIGERCRTAAELLQSAREFAAFLKPADPTHPAALECRDAQLGESIRAYVEQIEKIWRQTGRRVMDRISFRDLWKTVSDEETTIDYSVVADDCVSCLPRIEPYAVRETDFPSFVRFMQESD